MSKIAVPLNGSPDALGLNLGPGLGRSGPQAARGPQAFDALIAGLRRGEVAGAPATAPQSWLPTLTADAKSVPAHSEEPGQDRATLDAADAPPNFQPGSPEAPEAKSEPEAPIGPGVLIDFSPYFPLPQSEAGRRVEGGPASDFKAARRAFEALRLAPADGPPAPTPGDVAILSVETRRCLAPLQAMSDTASPSVLASAAARPPTLMASNLDGSRLAAFEPDPVTAAQTSKAVPDRIGGLNDPAWQALARHKPYGGTPPNAPSGGVVEKTPAQGAQPTPAAPLDVLALAAGEPARSQATPSEIAEPAAAKPAARRTVGSNAIRPDAGRAETSLRSDARAEPSMDESASGFVQRGAPETTLEAERTSRQGAPERIVARSAETGGTGAEPSLSAPAVPAQQVADAIRDSARPQGADASAPAGATRRIVQPASALHVVLEPPGLGSVSVRLQVSDERLRIDVQARDPRTRALIEADASLIAESLADAGLAIERITVTTAPSDAAASQLPEPRTTPPSAPTPERGPPADLSEQGRQGQHTHEQRAPSRRGRTTDDQDADPSSRIGADGFYV